MKNQARKGFTQKSKQGLITTQVVKIGGVKIAIQSKVESKVESKPVKEVKNETVNSKS